jgi:Flp pilus assembly protein TadG
MTRHRKSARGAELLELTIALPILLLSFAAIVDFAFMFQRFIAMQNAAREGARIAVLPGYFDPAGTNDAIRTRVQAYVQAGTGYQPPLADIAVAADSVDPGGGLPVISAVRVDVSAPYQFTFLGPIVALFQGGGFGSITLRASSTMRSEG